MKAIILSSGKGTRMMPLTKDTPKPLLAIKDKVDIGFNNISIIDEIQCIGRYATPIIIGDEVE